MNTMGTLAVRVVGALLLAVVSSSCVVPGDAGLEGPPTSVGLNVTVRGGNAPSHRGYDVWDIKFELTLSERDAEALGVSTTRLVTEEIHSLRLESKFDHIDMPLPVRPCVADDVMLTNLNTGEEFVVIEAGDCESVWNFNVEGAYDYLLDAGTCTGTVVLDDGREIVTPCR